MNAKAKTNPTPRSKVATSNQNPLAVDACQVTVAGQYYSVSESGKGIKNYSIQVVLPEAQMDRALSVIRDKLLDRAIKAKYGDAIGFRTHEIIKVNYLNPSRGAHKQLSYMSKKEIEEYCVFKGLEINFDIYTDISELRSAVKEATADYNTYKIKENKLASEREIDSILNSLNSELLDSVNEL